MKKRTIFADDEPTNLEGQLLIAMPSMSDPRFARSVIYLCAHSHEGAMGLIINQTAHNITFPDLLDRLDIFPPIDEPDGYGDVPEIAIHVGGPVDTGRGFVLHTSDYYAADSTLNIDDEICLTATLDILKAIAVGDGPQHSILALGYAGWSPGQLENEIQHNGWLNCDADPEIVFTEDPEAKYDLALAQLGIDPSHLVSDAGHA